MFMRKKREREREYNYIKEGRIIIIFISKIIYIQKIKYYENENFKFHKR